MQNLYDLLGVRPGDDAENLRRAYRKAVRESHPDHNGSDPDAAGRFRRITEAYGVLRDAERRAAYDEQLEFELRPFRWKLKRALFSMKRHAVYDLLAGAVLAAVLAATYELHVSGSATFSDRASVVIAPGAKQDFGAVGQADAAGRDRSEERVAAAQMPIVAPIAAPAVAPAENDVGDPEMTQHGPASTPSGEVRLAARDNESDDGIEVVDLHEMPSFDVQVSAPTPPSFSLSAPVEEAKAPEPSGASASGVKLQEVKMTTVRPQRNAAKRHGVTRLQAPAEKEQLENRDSENGPMPYVIGVEY
jgi:curved DNA-binding protein CbpA